MNIKFTRQTAQKNQKQQIHHPQIIVSQLSRQERQVHTHLDIRRLSQDSRNERDIKAKEGLLRCVSFKGQGNQCQGFDGEAPNPSKTTASTPYSTSI